MTGQARAEDKDDDATNPSNRAGDVDAKALYAKISWRLIPYIFILYILCYLDRVNVGLIEPELRRDLHLSETIFGLGGGIFFLGQLMFDLPSNLLLGKVGPRRWISRIMCTWGLIAAAMMFLQGQVSFLSMRLLLGISEAGFFPGMILYLTYWFPSGERARAVAKFMTATSIAGVVGGGVASVLLALDGRFGLKGWQWLFMMEGIPTFLMGISVLFVLKDHPDDANWLTDPEKKFLDAELERDRKEGGASDNHKLADAFKMPMVYVLAGIFLLQQLGVYALSFFMPAILNTFLHDSTKGTGSLVARWSTIPYLMAAIATVAIGSSSDRTGERRWHIAGCLTLSAAGLAWAAYASSFPMALMAMCLGAVGFYSMMGPFWALPTRVLGGQAAAGGVAIITMIGSLGSFSGPTLTGKLKDMTHSYTAGLLAVAGFAVLAAALCALLKTDQQQDADSAKARG